MIPGQVLNLNLGASMGRDDVVFDFGPAYGLWLWLNNASWSSLNGLTASHVITADVDGNGQDDVVIDLGASNGIWVRQNNSSWTQLHRVKSNFCCKFPSVRLITQVF